MRIMYSKIGLLALLLLVGSVFAEGKSPHDFVSKATQEALQQLRVNKEAIKTNPDALKKIITDYILPHMDFVAMSKLVLKSNWNKATAGQRQKFTGEFKNLLVRTYAKSLGEYSSEEIEFLPYEHSENSDRVALIKSQVKRSSGDNIPIHYRVRYKESDGWKVFDIIIEGVSLIKNYQGSFAREISQNGIDKLIEALQQKNNTVSQPSED